MNKIYYVVEKEVEDDELTGNKSVTAYKINNNIPIQIVSLEMSVTDNSKTKLNHWLEKNEFPDCELIQL
jgi:uncharacterized protein YbaR (Trm112 family)